MNDLLLRKAESNSVDPNTESKVAAQPGGVAPETAAALGEAHSAPAPHFADKDRPFVYSADVPTASAGHEDAALSALAQLVAHKHAETPISIGLFGGPGAGKSSALERLVSSVVEIAAAADQAGEAAPFCPHVIAVRIDAADGAGEPAAYLASRLYDAMTKPAGEGAPFASLAREAVASLQDVHAVAREAADQVARSRQRLETERRGLEDVAGRRARLAEAVLFETPGTRVDSYARAHRGKIEGRLRAFGFEGDLIAIWKEFVREMAERNAVERAAVCAQSLWSYRGQTRLLVLTVVFSLAAWGLGAAQATRAAWSGWMKTNGGSQIASLGGWLNAHAGLLSTFKEAATVAAVLCLVLDAWRAARFLNPIFRGASLLKIDLEARRRDLDALLAHQTRRVDLLVKEVDAQARRADAAERRAEGPAALVSSSEEGAVFYGANDGGPEARARFAREFLSALERVFARAGASAPRILVALDGFEHLSPERASAFAQTAGRLLARPGLVTLFALDENRFAAGFGAEAHVGLSRLVQIPVQIGGGEDAGHWVAGFLKKERSEGAGPRDARTSFYDRATPQNEAELLQALAPFAGPGPREAKRFVNLYRLAQACNPQDVHSGALAIALLSNEGGEAREANMVETASRVLGAPIEEDAIQKARAIVSRFRMRGA